MLDDVSKTFDDIRSRPIFAFGQEDDVRLELQGMGHFESRILDLMRERIRQSYRVSSDVEDELLHVCVGSW